MNLFIDDDVPAKNETPKKSTPAKDAFFASLKKKLNEEPDPAWGLSEDGFLEVEAPPIDASIAVPCQYITGSAGTGKTFMVREKAKSPGWGMVCATTGIAAVNLGTVTLNSTLKYFDTDSLTENYLNGRLEAAIRNVANQVQHLVIDEVSMMPAEQLDLIYRATAAVNAISVKGRNKLGLILCGDFCQLPPIKSKWAFQSECWPEFAANVTRLTKFWRQSDPTFLEALKCARSGLSNDAVSLLQQCKDVKWAGGLLREFDGTTIVAKNDQVDKYNWLALQRLKGSEIKVKSTRWGKQRGEWKNIPEELAVKEGAYVMLLTNTYDGGELISSNGDCGHIKGWDGKCFQVELIRNRQVVDVGTVTRLCTEKDPDPYDIARFDAEFDAETKKWMLGGVKYYPLRLAYAATVHKTQGLTLDNVQIDIRDHFMSQPGMGYVAMSRVRAPRGLRLVGAPDLLAKRIKIHPEVLPWV